jgi:hypothetical protein
MRVENQTKIRAWEDSSLCPETSTKNADQETQLRSRFLIRYQRLNFIQKMLVFCAVL